MKKLAFLLGLWGLSLTLGCADQNNPGSKTVLISGQSFYSLAQWNSSNLQMDLHLVRFGDGVWSDQEVSDRLRDISQIYLQCGLRLREIQLHERPDLQPGRLSRFEPHSPDGYLTFGMSVTDLPRPLMFLIDNFADTAEASAFALADYTLKIGEPPPAQLFNTIWMPDYVNSAKYNQDRQRSPYSVMAHELLHVLTLEGQHNGDPEPNLLSTWRKRNNRISAEQCAQVAQSELVKPVAFNLIF